MQNFRYFVACVVIFGGPMTCGARGPDGGGTPQDVERVVAENERRLVGAGTGFATAVAGDLLPAWHAGQRGPAGEGLRSDGGQGLALPRPLRPASGC